MDASNMRLGRLFNKHTNRTFVVAFDRGLSADASDGGKDASHIISIVDAAGADGILLSPGMLEKHRHLLAHRGAPAVLVRSDFMLLGNLQPSGLSGDAEEYRTLITAAEAAAMGADAMVMFLVLGNGSDAVTADNAQAVAQAARQAHAAGIPLIVEAVLWGSRVKDQAEATALRYACRLAAELGADAVKTQYTNSPETMREVIESCPVPVLLLGGPKADPKTLVSQSAEALTTGARGLVYGRNVWQTPDPAATVKLLSQVVHEDPLAPRDRTTMR